MRCLLVLFVGSSVVAALTGCGGQPQAAAPPAPQMAVEPVTLKVGGKAEVAPVEARPQDNAPTRVTGTFRLPDDIGGRLLAEKLPPRDPGLQYLEGTMAPGPRAVRPDPAVEDPRITPTGGSIVPPRLPLPEPVALLPGPVPEGLPLGDRRNTPTVPASPHYDTGPRVRVASPDATQVLPLPILAEAAPDRVSLDDPTRAASNAAALASGMPPRSQPVPFQKLTLPDPFELRHLPVGGVPVETPTPPAPPVRPGNP